MKYHSSRKVVKCLLLSIVLYMCINRLCLTHQDIQLSNNPLVWPYNLKYKKLKHNLSECKRKSGSLQHRKWRHVSATAVCLPLMWAARKWSPAIRQRYHRAFLGVCVLETVEGHWLSLKGKEKEVNAATFHTTCSFSQMCHYTFTYLFFTIEAALLMSRQNVPLFLAFTKTTANKL